MKLALRLACLSCILSVPGLTATWSGWLVNSRCYSSLDSNRSDVPSFVNWDQMGAIRYCSPNHKTKSFAIVGQSGVSMRLDPIGNEKAIGLLRNVENTSLFTAEISGDAIRHTINVHSLSIVRRTGH